MRRDIRRIRREPLRLACLSAVQESTMLYSDDNANRRRFIVVEMILKRVGWGGS